MILRQAQLYSLLKDRLEKEFLQPEPVLSIIGRTMAKRKSPLRALKEHAVDSVYLSAKKDIS